MKKNNYIKRLLLGLALLLVAFPALADSDPTLALTGVIITDWPLVLAAGVTVMVGVIGMAIAKKFRKVT